MITLSPKNQKRYMITVFGWSVHNKYDDCVWASSPSEAIKLFVRSLGGGVLKDIRTSDLPTGFQTNNLKFTQLIARADLLGGAKETTRWYLVNTPTDWRC